MLNFIKSLFKNLITYRKTTTAILLIGFIVFFRFYQLEPHGEPVTVKLGVLQFKMKPVKLLWRENTSSLLSAHEPATVDDYKSETGFSDQHGDSYTVDTNYIPDRDSFDRDSVNEVSSRLLFTPPPAEERGFVRLGTVRLGDVDSYAFSDQRVRQTLVETAERFDLLAVEGLYDYDSRIVRQWVELLNADKRNKYSFMAFCPPDQTSRQRYCAFVYNRTVIDADRSTFHVFRTDDHRTCPMITAMFTTRAARREAFTFMAVCVHFTPSGFEQQWQDVLTVLDLLKQKHPREDDYLVFGDFGIDLNTRPDLFESAPIPNGIKGPVEENTETPLPDIPLNKNSLVNVSVPQYRVYPVTPRSILVPENSSLQNSSLQNTESTFSDTGETPEISGTAISKAVLSGTVLPSSGLVRVLDVSVLNQQLRAYTNNVLICRDCDEFQNNSEWLRLESVSTLPQPLRDRWFPNRPLAAIFSYRETRYYDQ